MADRLTTGIAGLDAQLGGGVPPGTVHLLLAEPMNAQELFTYHFAAGGIKSSGHCTFVVTSNSAEQVQAGIKMVGSDPSKASVTSLANSKTWNVPEPDKGRYVLDSLSEVVLHQTWDKMFSRLADMRAKARENGAVILLTATPDLHTPREVALLKMWADGVMELGFDRQGFGLYPFLKVTKMRGVPDSARFLLFKETDRGLFMESTRRVF
ncbi:MAG TPA: RAD55 family ATPase [Candidatus Thermoplasmatota archaeon]|nr:RAD55 family ATPase [Candidatus Thermoplasmatota archaeon]